MQIQIERERPDTADAMTLIEELEGILSPLYPDESRHGYSVQKLIEQRVHFFVIRINGEPAGCGGVQFTKDDDQPAWGELKRMYVRPGRRGLGLAKKLLATLESHSAQHGIKLLRLETGIHQIEAIELYKRWGFQSIPPFGEYQADPNSLFFEKSIPLTAIDQQAA